MDKEIPSDMAEIHIRRDFLDHINGYEVGSDGELVVNPDEVQVVCWIFEQYLAGKALEKITAGLEQQGILSPTVRPKWNWEAIDKLLSNKKYTGRVLL